jgi:hypothetical protein
VGEHGDRKLRNKHHVTDDLNDDRSAQIWMMARRDYKAAILLAAGHGHVLENVGESLRVNGRRVQ